MGIDLSRCMNIEQVVQLVFYLILCVFTKKKYGAVQSCCLDKCSKSGGLCFPSPPARANLATAGRKIEEKWLLDTQLIIEDKIYESVFSSLQQVLPILEAAGCGRWFAAMLMAGHISAYQHKLKVFIATIAFRPQWFFSIMYLSKKIGGQLTQSQSNKLQYNIIGMQAKRTRR